MDSSVSGNSSPVSYTSKDDSTNNQSSNGSNGLNNSNNSGSTAVTSNTSVNTSSTASSNLGPIGSKPATPNTSNSSIISPWSNTQQQQPSSATRKASSNVVGSERGTVGSNNGPTSASSTTTSSSSSIFGNVGSNGTGDWFPPLKTAPGFERSRIGQYQQQNSNSNNSSSDALSSQNQHQQQHINSTAHPGMQARSVSTSGIASIGSGRRQVSEANSVRSSRPTSPSLSIVTSPSIGTSQQSFNPLGNLSLSSTLSSGNSASFGVQDQSLASLAAGGGGGAVTTGNGNNGIQGANSAASTTSELESAFDSMLRASPAFQDVINRLNRLEGQVQQLTSTQNQQQHDASINLPQHTNGHFDATPTRSPSVAGSTTSSYLTAPVGAAGLPNRPHSLLIPNHAPSPASIASSLHSPGLPPHAATEPSTPIYGTPNPMMGSNTERDAIRQLTVQLSALGNNVAQLMAQQQGPQTPSAGPGPTPYDMPHTPHGLPHPQHPGAMHPAAHHHPGVSRPNMQNIRSGSFADVPRGAVIPRGGPQGPYGDEREPRGKRSHLTLQAPTPVGMGSRRQSADVIENMHAAAEGMPGSAGGPAGSALGSQSLLGKWEALGISGDMLRAIVKYGIGPPSKIQMKAIPCVLNTQDIVAQASSIQERIQCYVIPTLQVVYNSLQQGALNEANEPPYRGVQAVVLTATIDQAGQAQRMCLGLGQALGITSSLVVGQGDASQEAASFANNPPHILVGTPQKLLDLLSLRMIPVDKLALLVIDEMDQLIARNLSEYVNNLAKLLPPPMSNGANSRERSPAPGGPGSGFKPFEGVGRPHERQTAIFSCTVPQEVLNFASALNLREPVRVLVRRENNQGGSVTSGGGGGGNSSNNTNDSAVSATPNLRGVKHWFLYLAMGNGAAPGRGPNGRQESASSREWKLEALADLCADAEFTQAVVYCSSIDSVEAVAYKLSSRNIDALALHGDMGAPARHAIISKFRSGNINQGRGLSGKRVLVVYDALCRTLSDIHQVAMVINYDLPRAVEDYIHRVSCAASSGYGRAGSSVNIVSSSSDIEMLRSIESYYRLKINELPPNLTNTF